MNFKFIGNAAGIFIGSENTTILCDPWIVPGVFEGSWFHYPPLKTKIHDLQNIDAIYVSHIHPDHYDERNFDFPKEIPIIILDEGPNFLKKNLLNKGYKNLIEIKNNQSVRFKEFNLSLFKPFIGHIYEESLLGNLVDSAMVINDNNTTAINFNDNTPTEKACIELKKKFKNIDLVMLNYNAAGPYPSCFSNLSEEEKIAENKRILKRNFDYLCTIIPLLEPKSVMPFAGSYIIGGKNFKKNKYLGTTTWDECADYLKKNLTKKTNIVCLRENQIFDILNQKNHEKYEKLDLKKMDDYIDTLKDHKYDYENDSMPDANKMISDINLAKDRLLEKSQKFKIQLKTNVFININGEKINILKGSDKERILECSMDSRLLRRILDRKSHWNNAEIGTHIDFLRNPNKMEPDVHTIMSFFHL